MIEFFGRGGALKPSWYGDCLPTRDFPMLIDLYLQGRFDLDRFVSRDDRARRGRGGLPQDGAGRGAALRRRPVTPIAAIELVSTQRDLLARRRGLRGRQQHLAASATTTRCSWSTPPTTPRRSSTPSAAGASSAIVCTHGHNDHINAAVDLADADRRAGRAAPGRPHAVGRRLPRPRARRRRCATATSCASRARDARGAAHAGALARAACCLARRPTATCSAATRCSRAGPGATGRSFSDFATIIESIRDRLLTLPRRHRRAHRPRRHDDDRRRGPAPRRVDRPGPLSGRRPGRAHPAPID